MKLIRTIFLTFFLVQAITIWPDEYIETAKVATSPVVAQQDPIQLPEIQWSNLPDSLAKWQGTWNCYHYGKMYLIVTDPANRAIAGKYTFSNGEIVGRVGVNSENLYGQWLQPAAQGKFHFRLGTGKFGPGWSGRWNYSSPKNSLESWVAGDPWDCTKISDDIIGG